MKKMLNDNIEDISITKKTSKTTCGFSNKKDNSKQ